MSNEEKPQQDQDDDQKADQLKNGFEHKLTFLSDPILSRPA